jgi:hypothetical protein
MSNTVFNNRKIRIPLKVSDGGTGRKSLTDKAVLIGTGTGNIHTVSPGVYGQVLTSDGINWISGVTSPTDKTVSYAKLGGDLVDKGSILSVDIDWSLNSIFTKTLSSNTVFTFSNYQLNKTITLLITGDYVLGFPDTVKKITGNYNGTIENHIVLHCIKSNAPQEILVFINQEA